MYILFLCLVRWCVYLYGARCKLFIWSSWCHTHTFNGPLSGTTRVSRYQKGKTNLDLTEARDSEWQWHQLGHMQVCTALQTDSHASTPPLSFFTCRMPFLPSDQQRQSTEGWSSWCHCIPKLHHRLRHLNPDRFTFLVPAYPGCPGKDAVKRVYSVVVVGNAQNLSRWVVDMRRGCCRHDPRSAADGRRVRWVVHAVGGRLRSPARLVHVLRQRASVARLPRTRRRRRRRLAGHHARRRRLLPRPDSRRRTGRQRQRKGLDGRRDEATDSLSDRFLIRERKCVPKLQ